MMGALRILIGLGIALPSLPAQTPIPATFMLPPSAADLSQPGFVWRVHQVDLWQPNENSRTERQLAGLLGDNLADPAAVGAAMAPADPADPPTAPIRFELPGVVNLNILGFNPEGNFIPDDPFPGLPGVTGGYENAAAEITAWVELPAGSTTLGVNSDDGFRLAIGGATPTDAFAPVVGEYNGGRGAGDSIFEITVSQAGLYAIRCIWEQGLGGANIELFSVHPDGSRVLLNDLGNGGLPAYRAVTVPDRAFARFVGPAPNATNASPDAEVIVELVDGAFPIDPASATLSLNGTEVPLTRSKAGGVTTFVHSPVSAFIPGSAQTAVLAYIENGSPVAVPWNFQVMFEIGPDGHRYEVVLVDGGITWPDAKAAAEALGGGVAVTHLATIGSYEEDMFLERLRQASRPDREDGQLWVGGYQDNQSADYWEPGGGWMWVNNEGPIVSYNYGWPYANWQWGQPDNAYTGEGGSEDYLAIGLSNNFGWNDDGYYAGGRNNSTLGGYIVEYEPVALLVDIKPGNADNAVNLLSQGRLPVAVLGTSTFDVTQLDTASIRFGRTGTEIAPLSWSVSRVNKDAFPDLMLHFSVADTQLGCTDQQAVMIAQTKSRLPARGADSIRVLDCAHFELTANAMVDVQGRATLDFVVRSLRPEAPAPQVVNKLQLKSSDVMGRERWTKNFPNIPLQWWGWDLSQGLLEFDGATGRQPIKISAHVPDTTGKSTEIIHAETLVRLRPDLAVHALQAPSTTDPCTMVNIVATLRELNGDLGASAMAGLYEDDQLIDTAWVWLGAGETADVVFSRVFGTRGSHELKVVVSDVSPGDYDLSNNSSTQVTITVGDRGFSPVTYGVTYSRQVFETQWEEQTPYYISSVRESGKSESVYANFQLQPYLQFPFRNLQLQLLADGQPRVDHELGLIEADSIYTDGAGYYDAYASRQIGEHDYVYVRSYSYPGGCYDFVAIDYYRSSADTVYHSEYHDLYWGGPPTVNDWTNQYGTSLEAATSLEIALILEHEAGSFGGTTGGIPVYGYPFNEEWNYEWPDYGFYRGFSRGENFYGSAWGTLTP